MCWLAVLPRALAVLNVPVVTFGAAVPLGSEGPDGFGVGSPGVGELVLVFLAVLGRRYEYEVAGVVVERVVILVVDVPAGRDGLARVTVPPDVTVEGVMPAAPWGDVVDPACALPGVRVALVRDASVDDGDGRLCHADSLSPQTSASIRVQPLPSTHTRWSGVAVSTLPDDSATVSTSASPRVQRDAVTGFQPKRVHTASPGITSSTGTSPRAVSTGVPAARQASSLSGLSWSVGAQEHNWSSS